MRLLRSLLVARDRAVIFYRRYGLWRTLYRLVRVWAWLPRLMADQRAAIRPPATPEQLLALPFGVNIVGYVTGWGSLAESNSLAARALEAAGVLYEVCDLTMTDVPDRQDTDLRVSNTNPYRFNLFFAYPPPAEIAYSNGRDLFAGRFNILFRPWEYDQLPNSWFRQIRPYDEIWTPAEFVTSILRNFTRVPVVTIPHPIAMRPAGPYRRSPFLASLPQDATTFLFIFNASPSSYNRKNAEGLVTAFTRAFSRADNAWLVIKARFGDQQQLKRKLKSMAAFANVLFIDAWLDPGEVDELTASCDCYVSLHHTEGFGLTIADAMAYGKPVISTSYSGSMEFTTPDNAYLVDHEVVSVDKPDRGVQRTWHWGQPDLDHAARLMRHVYQHPDEARARGERARSDIQRWLSFEAIGLKMKERLEEISAELAEKADRSEAQTPAP